MRARRSKLRLVSVKIDEDTLIMLDALSKETGKSRSELIRDAAHIYIKENLRRGPHIVIISK
jgi:metal-responsive CopG/Arc/MetJ family transcriptional regulator